MAKKRPRRPAMRVVQHGPWPYDWLRAGEQADARVIRQTSATNCTAACVRMLLWPEGGGLSQEELSRGHLHGSPASIDEILPTLVRLDPRGEWTFELFGPRDSFDQLDRRAPWLAFLMLSGMSNVRAELHAVIVAEGSAEEVAILDPHGGTSYKMARSDFNDRWTGIAIFRDSSKKR